MKKIWVILLVMVFIMAVGGNSMASIIDSPDVNGFGTFQDLNTGRIWLDMDNFFEKSTTEMVAAATAAGFTFATKADVEQLLYSLPLTGGEWPGYKAIMGDAPNRELIWGSYFETSSTVGWAWAYDYETSWNIMDSTYWFSLMSWDSIPNEGTGSADLNIWAYRSGRIPVPEPATMLLIGLGLVGLAGFRKRFI